MIPLKPIDHIIAQVNGSMRIEGMSLSSADKERIRRCVYSEKLVETEIQALIKKHSSLAVNPHEQRI